MSTYLLLRNNQESGPFTIEEIKEMNLKSYDLLWVVGKSASWRYPGEIPEIKLFAPPVPELPDERLLNKTVSENTPAESGSQKKSEQSNTLSRDLGGSRIGTGRSVYVNLPAEKKQPVISASRVIMDSALEPEQETAYDFSDIYNKKPSTAVRFSGKLLWGATILLLFGTGILTGLFISDRRKFFTTGANHPQLKPAIQPAAISGKTETLPVIQANEHLPAEAPIGPANIPVTNSTTVKSVNAKKKSKNTDSKKDSLGLLTTTIAPPKLTDSNRSETPSARNELIYRKVRANPESFISLSAGKFTTGIFGGISSFPVTVTNSSPVTMDLVVVQIDYIQNNDKIYKSENISFNDLEAGESVTIKAPKSPRGVKISTRIQQINAHKLDLNYTN